MFQRLATQIREQMSSLLDQYDARLSTVPGYANLPEATRRDLEHHVLELMAQSLEAGNDSAVIEYIHARAEQVLARGFQPEWFQQAVTVAEEIITPLIETVNEGNFVWRAMGRAQTSAWQIVARERQQAESATRVSEEQYRQAIVAAGAVPYYIDYTTERYRFIDAGIANLLGYPVDEITPTLFGQLIQETVMTGQGNSLMREAAIQETRAGNLTNWNADYRLVDKTGQTVWLHDSSIQILDEHGKPIGAMGILQDITERRQTEEQEQLTTHYLRAALDASKELTQAPDLDTLYRRTVELAREKLDVERCGLYLVDESREHMRGAYGTDDHRQTTDERGSRRTTDEFADILAANPQQLWVVRETPHIFVKDGEQHTLGSGWVAGTVLRDAAGPIGILFNDRALSGQPVDNTQQEALALYCSLAGAIIARKRIEEDVHRSLARRSVQVQTSTEIAQEIASATDLTELFTRVVTLIKERFSYYHAQVFRYEPDHKAVVLVTGYGVIGQTMLAAGHKLQMGRGVVGTAAATSRSILASDVRQDRDWQPNPHLPDTRGELAVPIKWRDQVLGILDVQSDQVNALTDDDRLLLEGLCGQIASALESTRLLEQLRRNETQLSEALQIAKLGYWEYDVENDLFHFNDQFYSIFHTTAEQAGGYQLSSAQYAQQYVHPDDLSLVGLEIEKALNSTDRHYTRDLEHRILYADGGVGYISVNINIERDEQGRILRYYGANQDITLQKLAELDLRKFKLGLERSSAAIFITDTTGVITYVNPAFEKVYGFAREEAIGQTPRILKSGLIPQEQYQHFWGALLAGQTVAGEIINKAKDGRLVPVQGSNSAIEDEQGNLLGFLALHNDISERKQAELELSRFKQGLEQASDAVFMTDVDGHITYVNPAFERIYGYSREEVLGKTPRILKSGQLSQEFYQQFWQTLLNKQSISGEKPNKTKDGRIIIIEDSNSPIVDGAGNLLGFLSTHRDITERKRVEQRMEDTLHETERLYAAVSHESWQAFRQTGQLPDGYHFDQVLVQPADQLWEPEIARAVADQALTTVYAEQRAVAVGPVNVRGETIGVLGVYDDPAHPLSKDDLKLIEAVSEQVALALESARLFEQTQTSLADTRALFRFSELASRETEIKPIFDNAAQLLVEETGFLGAWITQVDTQAQVLRGIAGAGAGMGPERNFDVIPFHMQTPATIAAREGTMIVVNDPLHDERLSDIPDQMKAVIGKSIAVPVLIDGAVDSIIAATRPIDGADITDHDQRLLQTAAAQVAIAVQRARLFEQTQRDAERERTINRVTSRIRNARSVDEVLSIAAQELRMATQASRSVVEIMPDADQPIYSGNGQGVKA